MNNPELKLKIEELKSLLDFLTEKRSAIRKIEPDVLPISLAHFAHNAGNLLQSFCDSLYLARDHYLLEDFVRSQIFLDQADEAAWASAIYLKMCEEFSEYRKSELCTEQGYFADLRTTETNGVDYPVFYTIKSAERLNM